MDQRRKFFIYPKFQGALIAGQLAIFVVASAYFLLQLYFARDYLFTFGEHHKIPVGDQYYNVVNNYIWGVFVQIAFMGLLLLTVGISLGVYLGHKTVGPIIRLKDHLKKVKENRRFETYQIRKGDYFQDLAVEVNSTLEEFLPKNLDKAK